MHTKTRSLGINWAQLLDLNNAMNLIVTLCSEDITEQG